MIVDSSAILAVLFREAAHDSVVRRLRQYAPSAIPAPALVESSIVITRRRTGDGLTLLRSFIREFDIAVIPFVEEHAEAAISAWLRFGKGRHPASLNLGDCLVYAIAKMTGEPLLCTGNDFSKTDLELA